MGCQSDDATAAWLQAHGVKVLGTTRPQPTFANVNRHSGSAH